MKIHDDYLKQHIDFLLSEDVGQGDLTSLACLKPLKNRAEINTRSEGVLAGLPVAEAVFKRLDSKLEFEYVIDDCNPFRAGQTVARIEGINRAILTGERLALNLLGRLSGIATLTSYFVDKIKDTGAIILDTRKTTPGLRYLEKYAVNCGGGENHRMGLYDMILIKDNHIAAAGSIAEAVKKARDFLTGSTIRNKLKYTDADIAAIQIEVEVESEKQLVETIKAGVKRILIDNRTPEQLKALVEMARSMADYLKLEASGGVTLDNVRAIAETGVDFISVGALTHSVSSSDFSLEIIP